MNKKMILLFGLIAGMTVILIIVGLLKGPKNTPMSTTTTMTSGGKEIKLHLTSPKKGSIENTVQTTGQIESLEIITLRSQVTGVLQHINIKIGDYVQKGQVLAAIDNPGLFDNLKMAETDYKLKNLEYDTIKRELENQEKLLALGSISNETCTKLTTELQRIRLEKEKLTKAIDFARQQLEATKIVAPFSGKIIKINETEGSNLTIGSELMLLANMNKLFARLQVHQAYLKNLKLGLPVRLSSVGFEDLEGSVIELPQMVESHGGETGFFLKSALKIKNNQSITLGTNVTGEIILERQNNTWLLPNQTLWKEKESYYIFLVKDKAITKLPISIGTITNEQVEITSKVDRNWNVMLINSLDDLNYISEQMKAK